MVLTKTLSKRSNIPKSIKKINIKKIDITNFNKVGLKLRCSAAKGYLNPVKKRSNLKIEVNAHVQKINFEGKKATGVNYYIGHKLNTVSANKEVILSAGSIGSPHILQVSGIGDSNNLKNLGI